MAMENGIYPDLFKKATIVPIYKSGDPTEASNYRPITLLLNFGKIFEKLIKIRLTSFLNKQKILSDRSLAFEMEYQPTMQ